MWGDFLYSNFKEGVLLYDSSIDRFLFMAGGECVYKEFHCGDCLQVEMNGEWFDTAFEMKWSSGEGIWYLVGTHFAGPNINHLSARISK